MGINFLENIVGKIQVFFDFKKYNSPSIKLENKAKEVTTQIGNMTINRGLTYSEVKDLIESVISQRLVSLHDEASLIYNQRINEFVKLFIEKIKNLSAEEISKLREPDTQLIFLEAANISGRKKDEVLHELLANLVVSRIKNDNSGKEELKNIVYNEAISTINKLTVDQLKIITLCYILRYTSHTMITSWSTFNNYLSSIIKPFLYFKNTNSEFQHIEYTGCGSVSIGSWDLIENYRQQYSFLYLKSIDQNHMDSLGLPEAVIKDIVLKDEKENKYFFGLKNKFELENYLKINKIDSDISKRFLNIYDFHLEKSDGVRKKIFNETDIGKDLLDIFDNSLIKYLSLTSVGIAIGASYFEQITGRKVDINIWIN